MSHQPQEQKVPVCPQYVVITPVDISTWPQLHEQLKQLLENYSRRNFIDFVKQRYGMLGFDNVRMLEKIAVEHFWNSTVQFMLNAVIDASHLISGRLNVMIRGQNTILGLSKLQVFVILSHMLMGTFPQQLYSNDLHLGKLISVMNEEDQYTNQSILLLRLNKFKAIIRYLCLFQKRAYQNKSLLNQMIVYQRYSPKQDQTHQVCNNKSTKLCKVQVKVGYFYSHENQANKISINNICNMYGRLPGLAIHDNQLDIEERIFFTHLEMLVMPVFMHEELDEYESVVVSGAEKYSDLNEVSSNTVFSFKQKFKDVSDINPKHNFRQTTFLFISRQQYQRKTAHNITSDVLKVFSAVSACKYLHSKNKQLISGNFQSARNRRNQMPWDLKFLVDWLGASLAGWHNFTYFVENELQATDLRIWAQEMKDYTFRDIVEVIEYYYEFKKKSKARIGLLDFCKDFVL